MEQSKTCNVCFGLAFVWIAVIGALAFMNWPYVPLDMSPVDPSTVEALKDSVVKHVAAYAAVAFLPPLVLWFFMGRRGAGASSDSGSGDAGRT